MNKEQLMEEWNKKIGTEDFEKEPEHGNREPLPDGTYVCEVNNIELKATKSNKLMTSIWFKVIEGQYKNKMIFSNQVVEHKWQINIVLEMLRQLSVDTEVEFEDYNQFADMLQDVLEEVGGNVACEVEYSTNDKGYSKIKIGDVWDK